MIIAIAGRKGCGKSTVANILIEQGFQKASFAAGLKDYVGQLYNWPSELLNSQEGKEEILESPVLWDKTTCEKLSKLIQRTIPFRGNRTFISRREALQYIGTDLLREIDSEFHVKEFKKRYAGGNYVCDDVRFPNELQVLKEMQATSIFILRPYFWDYSNHASEISTRRQDFDNLLLNDRSLRNLIYRFKLYSQFLLQPYELPYTKTETLDHLRQAAGNRRRMCFQLKTKRYLGRQLLHSHMLPVYRQQFKLNPDAFSTLDAETAFWAGVLSKTSKIVRGNCKYFLKFRSQSLGLVQGFQKFLQAQIPILIYSNQYPTEYGLNLYSPLLIEDLKLWNIDQRGSQLPELLQKFPELLNSWEAGTKLFDTVRPL